MLDMLDLSVFLLKFKLFWSNSYQEFDTNFIGNENFIKPFLSKKKKKHKNKKNTGFCDSSLLSITRLKKKKNKGISDFQTFFLQIALYWYKAAAG